MQYRPRASVIENNLELAYPTRLTLINFENWMKPSVLIACEE